MPQPSWPALNLLMLAMDVALLDVELLLQLALALFDLLGGAVSPKKGRLLDVRS